MFRRARTWQEAATIANESCVVDETSRALTDKGFQSTIVAAEPPPGKGGGRRRNKDQKNDETYVADGVPSESSNCKGCGRGGHTFKLCPKKAAERRGEVEALVAESKATGAVCVICSAIGQKVADHRARHHNLAAQDAFGSGQQQQQQQNSQGQAGGGKGSKGAGKTAAEAASSPSTSPSAEAPPPATGSKGVGKTADGKINAPCKLWALGRCTYGDRCKFRHDADKQPKASESTVF